VAVGAPLPVASKAAICMTQALLTGAVAL
jgi:hypothetical protein